TNAFRLFTAPNRPPTIFFRPFVTSPARPPPPRSHRGPPSPPRPPPDAGSTRSNENHCRPAGPRDNTFPSYPPDRLRANVEISESHRHANPLDKPSPTRHSFRPQCRYVEAILD